MKVIGTVLGVLILAAGLGIGIYFAIKGPAGSPAPARTTDSETSAAADAAAELAVDLYKKGVEASHADNVQQARELFEKVTKYYPDTWAAKQAWLKLGDIYNQAGDKVNALEAFTKGFDATTEENRAQVEHVIAALKLQLERRVTPVTTESIYAVRSGDTISSIARTHNTKIELIKLANNKLDDRIVPGQTLKITAVMPEIVVNLKKFELTLLWQGQVVRSFPVGIGQDNATPTGEFYIDTKLKNPPWYSKKGVIPYGHPDNILGTRWMGLKDTPDHSGYGIHGTTEPKSVPGATSAGCVRMRNEDVEELFEWVPITTKVTVR